MADNMQRSGDAQQVLDNPIYRESYEMIERNIVSQLRLADLDPARRTRLNDLLVALAKARTYIEQVMLTGRMEAQEMERERTRLEKMREGFRKVSNYR